MALDKQPWLTPEQRAEARGDAKVERYLDGEEDRAEEAAVKVDARFYHYPDGWFGMREP